MQILAGARETFDLSLSATHLSACIFSGAHKEVAPYCFALHVRPLNVIGAKGENEDDAQGQD